MKSLCTKGLLYLSLALLVVGAAACTQSKPAVPTPTLVPLANETLVPAGAETQEPTGGQPTPILEQPTLIPPPSTEQTPAAPEAVITPIIVEPTLLPTPTTVGDTGQVVQPTSEPGVEATPPSSAGGACSNPYTVQPGEWFYAIARKCGVTPQALLDANPGLNPNILRPGQTLNMPGGGAPESNAPPPAQGGSEQPPSGGSGSCPNPYTVQPGDTLFSIARKCGTTADALQQANAIPAPDYIFPGQQLRIP